MPEGFFFLVHRVVRSIPRGRVMTYGGIAAFLGRPGAARTVVYALRSPSGEGEIPWHRVVGAGGRIPPRRAFSDGQEHLLQAAMLKSEGVIFTGDGRVDLTLCLWDPEEGEIPSRQDPPEPSRR